jgi:hypothetical protein
MTIFPDGALSTNTQITIQPVTNTCPGGIGPSYDLLPNGTKFSKPVTVLYHYTNEDLPDNLAYFLFIAYQDSTGAWQGDEEQRDFDTVARTVSLDVNHFTIFSLAPEIQVIADRTSLQAGQTANIAVKRTRMTLQGDPNTGPKLPY